MRCFTRSLQFCAPASYRLYNPLLKWNHLRGRLASPLTYLPLNKPRGEEGDRFFSKMIDRINAAGEALLCWGTISVQRLTAPGNVAGIYQLHAREP